MSSTSRHTPNKHRRIRAHGLGTPYSFAHVLDATERSPETLDARCSCAHLVFVHGATGCVANVPTGESNDRGVLSEPCPCTRANTSSW